MSYPDEDIGNNLLQKPSQNPYIQANNNSSPTDYPEATNNTGRSSPPPTYAYPPHPVAAPVAYPTTHYPYPPQQPAYYPPPPPPAYYYPPPPPPPQPTYYPPPPSPQPTYHQSNSTPAKPQYVPPKLRHAPASTPATHKEVVDPTACQKCGKQAKIQQRFSMGCVAWAWCCCLLSTGVLWLIPLCSRSCKNKQTVCTQCGAITSQKPARCC